MRVVGWLTIVGGLLWGMYWSVVPTSISLLGFSGSCGVPFIEVSDKSADSVSQQCVHQSAQHLFVAFLGGVFAIVLGAVVIAFASAATRKPPPPPAPRVPASPAPYVQPRQQPGPTASAPRTPESPGRPHEDARAPAPAPAPVGVPLPATHTESAPSSRRRIALVTVITVAGALIAVAAVLASTDGSSPRRAAAARSEPVDSTSPTSQPETTDASSQAPPTDIGPTAVGYGPVKIGMTRPQLESTGEVTSWTPENQDGGCDVYSLSWPGASVWFQRASGTLTDLAVVAIDFGPHMSTAAGIHDGSTVNDLRSAYPDIDTGQSQFGDYTETIAPGVEYTFETYKSNTVERIVLESIDQGCAN